MSITRPYYRIWRPLLGYELFSLNDKEDKITLDYLSDDKFANQAEIKDLLTYTNLLIRDLYEIFNYIDPDDRNLNVFSHRLYEIFVRACTEIESSFKGIFSSNGYTPSRYNMEEYFKIGKLTKLNEYTIKFSKWNSNHIFQPFKEWSSTSYQPISWYQAYNQVKHNRHRHIELANLENVMNAVSGLLCLLHSQIGGNVLEVCFEGLYPAQTKEEKAYNSTFTLIPPMFPNEEKYEFSWNKIKDDPEAIQAYPF